MDWWCLLSLAKWEPSGRWEMGRTLHTRTSTDVRVHGTVAGNGCRRLEMMRRGREKAPQ